MKTKTPPRLLGGLALCAALLPAVAAAQPAPLTPEIQVSGPQLSAQYLPSVAAEPDGDFVVAWTDLSDPNDRAIRVRRYTASGMAATGALRVGQSALPTGVDAAGTPRTGEIEIHPSSSVGGGLANPSLAATPEGFVVAWSGPVNDRRGIFARRYDSAGAPLGPELRVDTGTVELVQHPAIAADVAGGFIVVWEVVNGDPASQRIRIAGRLFDAAGTPRGGELRLDERTQDFRSSLPSVAIAPDGSFFVAWARTRQGADVVGRLFGADGAPRGPALRLNGPEPGQERMPRVAADPGGGFLAVWSFLGGSNFEPGPRGRRVDAAGHPWGPELRFGHQRSFPSGATVAFSSAGEFVAAWHGIFNGSPVGVFAQRFRSPGLPAPIRAWSRRAASPATRCARESRPSKSMSTCGLATCSCWAT